MEPTCPNCRQRYTQRIHRQGWFEHVLSIIYVYPFRCQLCTCRFRAMAWGHRYAKEHVDQRQLERFPVNCPARFFVNQTRGPDLEGDATVTDLSMGGCGFETRSMLEPGMLLRLQIQTWEDQQAVRVAPAVVRAVRPRVIGVEFLDIPPPEKQRLGQFVQSLFLINRGRR